MKQSVRLWARLLASSISGVAVSFGFAAQASQAPVDSPDAQPTIAAKWQPVDLKFTYTPSTTYYSCDSLEWKLERIFKAIGAHPKSQVTTSGCQFNGPSRFTFVHFVGAVPVPATTASPVDQDSASKQELLKRLGVQPQFEKTEFQARRTQLDLSRLTAAAVEPGDCELLEQLGRGVLQKFGTTQVRNRPRCFPGHVPLSTPSMQLDVLIAAANPDAPQPAENKSK